ncbi:MAG: hypothetical protein Q9215_002782 [Flavoplaca cf. flavocitrina]
MPTLDRIAPELQHMIFAGVGRADIPNLRLTCKALAEVGSRYTFETLCLSFSTRSFYQLQQVSKLPVKDCVRTLEYDVWETKEYNLEAFMECIHFDEYPPLRVHESRPAKDASPRDWRMWRRCGMKLMRPPKTKRQSRKEWRRQRTLFLDQQSLRKMNYGQASLNTAIARLVNLEHISFTSSAGYNSYEPYQYCEPDSPYGLPQIMSVFQAISTSETTLKSLELRSTNWRVFEIDGDQHQMMKRIVSSLQSFLLHIETNEERDEDEEASAEACAKLFGQGRPFDLFQSMPHLQVFMISIEAWNENARRVNLKHVVGQFCWPRLCKVSLDGLETTSEELLQFFQRHAETLRVVTLLNIQIEQESWPDILEYMRTALKLEGFVFCYTYGDHWCFDLASEIEAYVLKTLDFSFHELVKACQWLLEP